MQKIKGDENTLGTLREGGDKKAKIHRRSYEITEIPRGGGDKKAKTKGGPIKSLKFLGG